MKKIIDDHFRDSYRTFYKKYLVKVKPSGSNDYMAQCPFGTHEDKKPSFSFSDKKGTYFCHTCGKKGHIAHFYAKLHGLDTRRDFPKILKGIASDFGIPWQETKSKMVATYDYVDPMGELLFQVCRMEPKRFFQRRPDGNGSWITRDVFKKEKGGIDPVLYRLPEVISHNEVILVEGEKDADALASLGFCSTTCPMGAKKWKDTYNESLKGKHIVLIPDNDIEGKEHMAQVGASLNGMAASLKLLELPDLPSKGDFSDWLLKFPDKETAAERLSVMIEAADPYEPPKQASIEDAIWDDDGIVSVELPEKQGILEPWLKEGSITLVPGWRGIGKTWKGMGIVDAVTRGIPFGPWEIIQPVPCLYLEGEMPAQDVRERILSLKHSDRKSPLYVYTDAYANQLGLPRANLLSERWREKMKSILLARYVKLWVVDNLASLAPGIDENIKRDWDPINTWLLELRFAGIATILLHHTNKEGDQRGTSAREDNIDTTILLKHPPDYTPEDGAKFIAHFRKSRFVRTHELPLIADTVFHLVEDESGRLVWSWGNVKQETRMEILKLMDEGHRQTDIANMLSITRGYVSRIVKTAMQEGLLTPKGKLTQSGCRLLYEDEN